MVRPAESIGEKWGAAVENSIPDAKRAYLDVVPTLANKIIAQKGKAKTNFSAALDSPAYDSRLRARLTVDGAGLAYSERLDQIAQTGFTESQKNKIVEDTILRRHLARQIASVVALADGATGNLKFVNGISNSFKRAIINSAMMQFVDQFTPTTTAAGIVTVLKTNIASIPDLSIGS